MVAVSLRKNGDLLYLCEWECGQYLILSRGLARSHHWHTVNGEAALSMLGHELDQHVNKRTYEMEQVKVVPKDDKFPF